MQNEQVYHEYANWKLENDDLVTHLKQENSGLLLRFEHILLVLEYLYDKLIDDSSYSEEEDNIFITF